MSGGTLEFRSINLRSITEVEPPVSVGTGRRGPGNFDPGGYWDDGGSEYRRQRVPARAYRTGMWMALAAIFMVFAAFTSTMVIRQGIASDWNKVHLPHILYFNTLVLLASSVTIEICRRAIPGERRHTIALYATTFLGAAFVAGQLVAWRELVHEGVYLASNPASSSFYLMTGAHGLHLLGGVLVLAYLLVRARKMGTARLRTSVSVAALYWHFMDGLWIYILLLLMVRL